MSTPVPDPDPDHAPDPDRTPVPEQPYRSAPPPPPRPPVTNPAATYAPDPAAFWSVAPGGTGGPAVPPTSVATASRPRWWPLVGTATAAALAASLLTAGLTGAFAGTSDEVASLEALGRQESVSVPVAGSTGTTPDWQAVAATVRDSVVAIDVQSAQGSGQGSGVVIDTDGNILTNDHVVSGAVDGGLRVTLADGRVYPATIVGTDPTTDLAVIRLTDPPGDLSPAVLGSSDEVRVGAPVMAVGNPLGLDSTVTTGIVSALDRPVTTSGSSDETVVTNAIQIDAAINPGNSGGPLFDASGEVIGITSSIATLSGGSSRGSIGLGFAIPADLAARVADQLITDGTVEHAFLGVSLSDGTATASGTTRRGAVVEEVTADSPAGDAGIRVGDVVVAIDGDPVNGAESLTAFVRERAAGEGSTLTVVRSGEVVEVEVTFAVRQAVAAAVVPEVTPERGRSGPRG